MALEKLETEIRQEQIAKAAIALIASKGVRELNMAEVAKRVGLVPSAIYRHFDGKDALIDSIIMHIRRGLESNVKKALEGSADELEQLEALLTMHVELIRQNRGILHVVLSAEVFNSHPERKAKIYQMVKGYLGKVAAIIAQGQKSGRIRTGIDPGTVSVMFFGLIQPAAILSQMSDGEFDPVRHAHKAWKVFRFLLEK